MYIKWVSPARKKLKTKIRFGKKYGVEYEFGKLWFPLVFLCFFLWPQPQKTNLYI